MADYVGLYQIIEKIKIDKNRLAIPKLGPMDNTAPAVTGGYLFKNDGRDPDEIELPNGGAQGWRTSCEKLGLKGLCADNSIVLQGPKAADITPAQKKYISDAIDTFSKNLVNKSYEADIDVGAWIDHHILQALAKNPDAFRLSWFLHKDRNGKIAAGPVWDFDSSLGNIDERSADPKGWDGTNVRGDCSNIFNFVWYRGLFADAKFRAAYAARWKELIAGPLAPARMNALMDSLATQVSAEAAMRDRLRWMNANAGRFDLNEIAKLKTWLSDRVQWVGGCLNKPDPIACN